MVRADIGDVASEFQPGHPVVFWIAILAVTFALFSAARAAMTYDDCSLVGSGAKHWSVWPPEWVCDG